MDEDGTIFECALQGTSEYQFYITEALNRVATDEDGFFLMYEEGYIDIDLDEIVKYIVKEAKKDDMGPYEADDVFFVVQGEMEYADTLEEE